jgi:hypothetical protein
VAGGLPLLAVAAIVLPAGFLAYVVALRALAPELVSQVVTAARPRTRVGAG